MDFYTNVQVGYNEILYRGVENGVRVTKKIPYNPTLFLPTKNTSKFTTLDGRFVEKVKFNGLAEARSWIKEYEDTANMPIYGNKQYQYCYISDNFPEEILYDESKILVANIDIEVGTENGFGKVELADQPVISITMKLSNIFYVFGTGDFVTDRKDIIYSKCENEHQLLTRFLDLWQKHYPDVITGWNTSFYDVPYLINRITNLFGEDEARKISPWKKFSNRTVLLMGRPHTVFDIVGVAVLDYLEMYKKFAPIPNQENYKLNTIATVELKEKKVSYEEYEGLHGLYTQNHQKFIEYNIKDVELVDRLEEKMKLISLVLQVAYDAKANYNDVFTQVRIWDVITYNELKKRKNVVPQKQRFFKETSYVGGYVKDPQLGMHNWVVSYDLDALYPNLIQMFNISPETLITDKKQVTTEGLLNEEIDLDYLHNKSVCIAGNGYHFKTEKEGFLGYIMNKMVTERFTYKKKMTEAKQSLEAVNRELEKRK